MKSLFEQVFEMNAKYLEQEFGKKALELAMHKTFKRIALNCSIRNDFSEPPDMVERKKRYGRL